MKRSYIVEERELIRFDQTLSLTDVSNLIMDKIRQHKNLDIAAPSVEKLLDMSEIEEVNAVLPYYDEDSLQMIGFYVLDPNALRTNTSDSNFKEYRCLGANARGVKYYSLRSSTKMISLT